MNNSKNTINILPVYFIITNKNMPICTCVYVLSNNISRGSVERQYNGEKRRFCPLEYRRCSRIKQSVKSCCEAKP